MQLKKKPEGYLILHIQFPHINFNLIVSFIYRKEM